MSAEAVDMPRTSMRLRTVRSPAGQTISIIADGDYAEMVGVPLLSIQRVVRQKLVLLRALWVNGTISDASGRATMALHEAATAMGYRSKITAVHGLLTDPVNAPTVERKTGNKRTYSIDLVALPETWLARIRELDAESVAPVGLAVVPEPAYEAVPVDPESHQALESPSEPTEPSEPELVAEPEPEPFPETYLEVAPTIAMALLTQVVEIISAGDPQLTDRRVRQLEREMSEQGQRLAQRLAENDSLRRQVREAGDQIIALKHERDGIFKRMRIAEHNLERVSNIDTERYVKTRVEQEITKLMQAKPGTTKGDD